MDYNLLVKQCLKQKSDAQRQLYEHFAPAMFVVCYRYTKSTKDSEDILQEGFVKVFKNLHQYRSEGELGAWIRRIMVTTALNYLKRNKKYQNELSFTNEVLHPVSDENPTVKLDAKQLADLVRQLPTGFQTIFNLYAIEGYSHIEIAEMLGINEGTSRSQYSRARALLISWIEKHSSVSKRESYAGK
ncbi:RNA polymerase sigma factor [Ferruginibacter albus]|uniref:RNA polymerase sigma factor n=1 Tax=Ferruginibacter albus TaxID=2875540 RepID=UPI001CC55F50|nr:RNA polymerase sigma factor [Ferruginibacter albus]UAY51438.1 RNA polymerase sigma factor [Ferruginibacter albus]